MRGFLERHLADDGFAVLAAADPLDAPEPPADLVLLGDPAALERWRPPCPVIVLGAPDADPSIGCARSSGVRRLPQERHIRPLVQPQAAALRN